jgi:triacylglycerol lipase
MSKLVQIPQSEYDPDAFASFDPSKGFALGNARALMWLSQLAYETYEPSQPEKIAAVAPAWQFETLVPFCHRKVGIRASYNTCGLLGECPAAVVIAFAGTDPAVWQTVITDFTLRLGGDTHAGFQAAADAVRPEIDKAIALSRAAQKPLLMAGHSLGGAIAALAASRAADQGAAPAAVYGFGMPRVGNARFHAHYTAALGERTFRLVHGIDIVPTVPPSILGFRHVGRMLDCASGGSFAGDMMALSSPEADDPLFTGGLQAAVSATFANLALGKILSPIGPGSAGTLFALLPQPIRDHLPDRYWTALTP